MIGDVLPSSRTFTVRGLSRKLNLWRSLTELSCVFILVFSSSRQKVTLKLQFKPSPTSTCLIGSILTYCVDVLLYGEIRSRSVMSSGKRTRQKHVCGWGAHSPGATRVLLRGGSPPLYSVRATGGQIRNFFASPMILLFFYILVRYLAFLAF